jgi:opacity protein-like surface antigen
MKGNHMLSLKTLRATGIAALLVVGGVATATAADMSSPPPPPPMMPAPAPMDVGGGFYLRGDVGMGHYNHSRIDTLPPLAGLSTVNSSMDGTVFVGIGAGYQFNSFLRTDVTGEYRFSSRHRHVDSWGGGAGSNLITGKVGGFVGLANAYVDLGTWNRITPFIGAGIGFASMTMGQTVDRGFGAAAGTVTTGRGKTSTNLAWAIHAGLGYDLSANWKAEVGYRYLHIGDVSGGNVSCVAAGPACPYRVRIKDMTSHDVKFGLRYVFADAAPIFAPGPLVRKY